MGWVVNATPRLLYAGKETRYTLYRSLGGPQGRSGRVRKISPPTAIRCPDRPARSESLQRLSYPGPHTNTPSPCITNDCFALFSFNAHDKFTPILHSPYLIFSLTPFGCLHAWTLPREYGSHGEEQNWEAACSLQNTTVTVCTPFSSDRVVYLHLFKCLFFFVLHKNTTMIHPIEEQKMTDDA